MPFAFFNFWFWVSILVLTTWCLWPIFVADYTESRVEASVGANGGYQIVSQKYYSLGGAMVALASCIGTAWVSIYVIAHLHPHGKLAGYETFFLIAWGIIAVEAVVAITQVERPVQAYSTLLAVITVFLNVMVTTMVLAFYPGSAAIG
jgi:hypothetical protein